MLILSRITFLSFKKFLGILAILFFISTGLFSSINNNFTLNWRKIIQTGMTVSIMVVIVWKLTSHWGKTEEKSLTELMKACNLSPCIPYRGLKYFENSTIESYFSWEATHKYLTLGMYIIFIQGPIQKICNKLQSFIFLCFQLEMFLSF